VWSPYTLLVTPGRRGVRRHGTALRPVRMLMAESSGLGAQSADCISVSRAAHRSSPCPAVPERWNARTASRIQLVTRVVFAFLYYTECQHLLLLSASLLYTLYDCIRNSSNSLLIAYVESDLFYHSKLLHKWRRLRYTCVD